MNMQQIQKELRKQSYSLHGKSYEVNTDMFIKADKLDRVELVMLAEEVCGIDLDLNEDEAMTTFGAFVITVWNAVKDKENNK